MRPPPRCVPACCLVLLLAAGSPAARVLAEPAPPSEPPAGSAAVSVEAPGAAGAAAPPAAAEEPAAAAPAAEEPSAPAAQDPGAGATAGPAVEAAAAPPEAAPTTAEEIEAQRRSELTLRLSAVDRELEENDTLLPWIVLLTGVAATTLAVTTATLDTLDCADSCRTGVWQSLTVIGGATLTSVGAVWLGNVMEDRHQLDLQRDRVERQLENIHDNRPLSGGPGVSLRGRF